MLSYIPVILVVGIYVGKSVPRSSDQCVRVASLASAPICNINNGYMLRRWSDFPLPCGVLGATCCHEAHRLSAGARPNAPQQPQS